MAERHEVRTVLMAQRSALIDFLRAHGPEGHIRDINDNGEEEDYCRDCGESMPR